MFSGVGLATAFDWDSERINYESVRKNFDELELVARLRLETIHCDTCGHRLVIDYKVDGIVYCACSKGNTCASRAVQPSTKTVGKQYEKPWTPYMERKNMIIWRREDQPGLFAYKGSWNGKITKIFHENQFTLIVSVYASYDDISAEDFLHIQTDTEYRKEWDQSAVTLDVIDTDPVHRSKSHIIHWEMQWPVKWFIHWFHYESSVFSTQLCVFLYLISHRNSFQIEIMCSIGDSLSIATANK